MKVLVTGRHGQLARSLADLAKRKPGREIMFVGRPEVDLEDRSSIDDAMSWARPDLVINAAAYTHVDNAESEPERALRVNADAAGDVAAAASKFGAPIIQISTDYVFDGSADRPYREDDLTGPINVYGASKLAGEVAVRNANARHLILRTSWVYSPFGRNFVATMLQLAKERGQIEVVSDQIGSPTSSIDLADAILAAIDGGLAEAGETFHVSGAGQASWAELAEEVMRASTALGGPCATICPIPTQRWPTPARRPSFSALDCARFEALFGARPQWRTSISGVVGRLLL